MSVMTIKEAIAKMRKNVEESEKMVEMAEEGLPQTVAAIYRAHAKLSLNVAEFMDRTDDRLRKLEAASNAKEATSGES